MKAKGLDQKTLAEVTGLSPTTVGKLYRNQYTRLDNQTIDTLVQHFKLAEPNDLFYFHVEN